MAETGTALGVVEQQQAIVGDALVGASGSAVLAESTDSTSQILEQIRDIQLKTLRGIGEVVSTMKDIFDLDKLQDRRAKEDQTELDKEKMGVVGPVGGGDDGNINEDDKKKGGMFAFLGGIPGGGFFKKMFGPILAIFSKGGLLVKLFGKFGPLGALIIGFTLLYKYSDEIAAALAPALDKIKELIPKLKPVIDFLKMVGDFFIKTILTNMGGLFENIIDSITNIVDGFQMLFDGDILGGLSKIFGGIFDFVLAFPKAILDTVVDLLTPLASAVGDFFKQLYDDIVLYITDTITNIKNFFIDLATNILTFFTDAYNTVKTTITDAVQGAFNFIADIFNSISDFMSSAYTKAKNFVTSLPDRILGFISNMFSPIIDFFNAIGNRIKTTINGVIDALPLPNFVKDKIKFDVEPSQDELDSQTDKAFEKLEAPDTADEQFNKSGEFFAMVDKHKDDINKFMKATGYSFDLQGSKYQFEKGAGKYFSFDRGGEGYMTPADDFNAQDSIDFINSGKTIGFADVKSEPTDTKTNIADVGSLESNGATTTIVNNNTNVDNSSVASQTDVHSGSLDTGVDTYHDKMAYGTF